MAKYNPDNLKHRAWLASNILDLLQKWGFNIDFSRSKETWEFVCSRIDKYNPSKKIIIYTSIDKRSAGMRERGSDRIRVVREQVYNKEASFQRVALINRTGEFKEINNRICKAIIKAQKENNRVAS
tara:strand:- start:107 stop:484 length:378 start_codon:yes stop_codon:yes gene_type:complete